MLQRMNAIQAKINESKIKFIVNKPSLKNVQRFDNLAGEMSPGSIMANQPVSGSTLKK